MKKTKTNTKTRRHKTQARRPKTKTRRNKTQNALFKGGEINGKNKGNTGFCEEVIKRTNYVQTKTN